MDEIAEARALLCADYESLSEAVSKLSEARYAVVSLVCGEDEVFGG